MDYTIYPEPNPAVSACLLGPQMRAIMEERANMALLLYQAQVAKRTGRLARSARAHVEIGGKDHDRWIGELIIGGGIDYGASHEFGVNAEVEGPVQEGHDEVVTGGHHAAHDLNQVLAELGNY